METTKTILSTATTNNVLVFGKKANERFDARHHVGAVAERAWIVLFG